MSKNHQKSGQKFLQRNFFFVSCGKSFMARTAKKCPKNMPAKFQGRAVFVPGFFFQQKVTQRWWTDILLPRSLSLAALLGITCCCYVFIACPRDSMANSAARSKIVKKVGRLSLSPESHRRCPVHDRDVDVYNGKNPVFLTSKALVTSFLANSFYLITEREREKDGSDVTIVSLLCWAHKRKNSVSLKAKSNFNPFSSHRWKNESFRRTGSCDFCFAKFSQVRFIKFVKYFTFGSGCTALVRTASLLHVALVRCSQSSFFSRVTITIILLHWYVNVLNAWQVCKLERRGNNVDNSIFIKALKKQKEFTLGKQVKWYKY